MTIESFSSDSCSHLECLRVLWLISSSPQAAFLLRSVDYNIPIVILNLFRSILGPRAHNSPLKCSQLSLRQKRSFNHTSKLCTCFVCSHVLTSFHLSPACSWSFKIHDFTFMVSSGCLSPTLYSPIRIQRFLSPLIYGWEIYRPFFTLIKGKLGASWGSFSRSGDLSWSNLPRSIFPVTHRCVDSLVSIFT